MHLAARTGLVILIALMAACASIPAPQYQPSISNTDALLGKGVKIGVGGFSAATGVENKALGVRGLQLNGGGDGTYATYLREAAIKELQTASAYDASSPLSLTGTLTHNELNGRGIKTGSAEVGAEFQLTRDAKVLYRKTLDVRHEWKSSFMGAVAIPAAVDNYSVTVQKLLGKLFSDHEFVAAAASR